MTTLVIGAGAIGLTLTDQLIASGEPVRLATRSGSGPEHPLVERMVLDASDDDAVARAITGVRAVHHCMHTAYTAKVWRRDLPPAERVVLDAAASVGIPVVFPESLYGLDATTMPLTEQTPITSITTGKRAVRVELLAARAAHSARSRSVAASDYFGPHAGGNAHAGSRMVDAVLDGRTARPIGSVDAPHSFTYLPDLAAAMIRAAELNGAGHQLLFAPTAAAVTQRELIEIYARAADRPTPRIAPLSGRLLRLLGSVYPMGRELAEMAYQFDEPFVMDSRRSEALLQLSPTPLSEAAATTIAWHRSGRPTTVSV